MTALSIDTCSHFCWFINPQWMQIKRNLKQSLVWWMISWENSTAFCLFKPSPLDWDRHTKTHFQVPCFLCRSSEVRKIWCYQSPQIQSRRRSSEPSLEALGFLNSRSLWFRKSWCAESIVLLLCPCDKKNSLKQFHHNNDAHCGTDNAFFFSKYEHFFGVNRKWHCWELTLLWTSSR